MDVTSSVGGARLIAPRFDPMAEARNCEVERPSQAACAMIFTDLEAVETPLGIAALV